MRKNLWLAVGVFLLILLPLVIRPGSEFGGADGAAQEAVLQLQPDYKPWFDSLWTPPGPEVESFLFAAQAAIGGAFVGYYIGRKKGRGQ